MSELTNILIKKINKSKVSVQVSSFRDDVLPNTKLSNEEIANTAFTLYVNSLSEYNSLSKELKNKLEERFNNNFLDKYFSKSTTNLFIKEASETATIFIAHNN